jgi:uncharacterized protein
LALIGLVAGLSNGLLGIGGGAVMVPLLVFFAGLQQKQAQAASLWFVVPIAFFSGTLYIERSAMDIDLGHLARYVALMTVAAFLGASIGVRLLKKIRQNRLKYVFGVFIIVLGVAIVAKALLDLDLGERSSEIKYLVTTCTGFMAGFLGALFGIGGGVLVVPALVLIGGFGQVVAQGISLWYVVPTAFYSMVLYHFYAKIRIEADKVATMIATGLVGGFFGVVIVGRLTADSLQIIFAAAMVLMGIIIMRQAAKEAREHVLDGGHLMADRPTSS